LDRLTGRG